MQDALSTATVCVIGRRTGWSVLPVTPAGRGAYPRSAWEAESSRPVSASGQALRVTEPHVALFARPPTLVAADRGVRAAGTEQALRERGVRHVAIPASGTVSASAARSNTPRPFADGPASARASGGASRA
jgi:hypothetical protein